MSHKLFRHSILSNARVWDFLKQVDAAEAQARRAAGCPRCGSALHSASYPRKPHGLAADLRDDVRRFSLCCSVCRRRVKPASVRCRCRRAIRARVCSGRFLPDWRRYRFVVRERLVPRCKVMSDGAGQSRGCRVLCSGLEHAGRLARQILFRNYTHSCPK